MNPDTHLAAVDAAAMTDFLQDYGDLMRLLHANNAALDALSENPEFLPVLRRLADNLPRIHPVEGVYVVPKDAYDAATDGLQQAIDDLGRWLKGRPDES